MTKGGRVFVAVLAAAALIGAGLLRGWFPSYPVINITPSVPVGLYWATRFEGERPILKGETVMFAYQPEVEWLIERHYEHRGTNFIKYVLGTQGMTIQRKGQEIVGCDTTGCALLGKIRTVDSKGRLMTLAPLDGTVIPPGFLFVGNPEVDNSLDSRYLGLIAEKDVKAVLSGPHIRW